MSDFKVGDFVFLFFNRTGLISPARILEKNIRENIEEGLKIEYFLEVYKEDGQYFSKVNYKLEEENCSMYSSIEELRGALEEHINNAVKNMVDDCNRILELATNKSEERDFEENIIS